MTRVSLLLFWLDLALHPFDQIIPLSVVIAVGGWGVPTEGLPRTPGEIKAYMNDINQAPGLPVPKWFHEFLDLMLQDDNWRNAVYDEYLVRTFSLIHTKNLT